MVEPMKCPAARAADLTHYPDVQSTSVFVSYKTISNH